MAVLKKELSGILKAKSSSSVYVLAVQLLLTVLKDSYNWSESVAKVTGECKISIRDGIVFCHEHVIYVHSDDGGECSVH